MRTRILGRTYNFPSVSAMLITHLAGRRPRGRCGRRAESPPRQAERGVVTLPCAAVATAAFQALPVCAVPPRQRGLHTQEAVVNLSALLGY